MIFFSPTEAELYVGSQDRIEIKYDMIRLTDEMKMLDGCIIDCRYFDYQWIFMKQRHDHDHPNGRQAVKGIKLSSLIHLSSNGDFSFPLTLDSLFFFYFFLGKMEALANQVSRDFLLAHLNIARGLE